MKAETSKMLLNPDNLVIYEINTGIWLNELSQKYQEKIHLANVPAKELDKIAKLGFSAIWMMGVWKRSAAGLAIAKDHDGIMKELREALPDMTQKDIAGSPYCIKDYLVDAHFGGIKGLSVFRKELADRGIGLILDYVPNHVAPDHPWTKSHPEFFIRGTEEELARQPEYFFRAEKSIYAKARDPFYPPWPDVLQLNIFNQGLRETMVDTLLKIAGKCDGIRCDMAMLVMNDIFSKTWQSKAGQAPIQDFWNYVIPAVKQKYPHFFFIAESYWDTEQDLINQGFDFCYDKRFYDYLKEGAGRTASHLAEIAPIRQNLLHFLENHDESRAAGLYSTDRNMAMALASLTLPGARLFHEGQLHGRKVKVPVFLSRRPKEAINDELVIFYEKVLKILHFDAVCKGKWSLCQVSGWPDNKTYRNVIAWEWHCQNESLIIAVNLSNQSAQALVKPGISYLPGRTYQLYDVISGELYRRDGEELTGPGLYIMLRNWGIHAFHIEY